MSQEYDRRSIGQTGKMLDVRQKNIVLAPHLLTGFVILSAFVSIVPFLFGFLLGLSVSSDLVFGIYALISGVAVDLVFTKVFRLDLVVLASPRIRFVWLWAIMCGYIMIFEPFT